MAKILKILMTVTILASLASCSSLSEPMTRNQASQIFWEIQNAGGPYPGIKGYPYSKDAGGAYYEFK